MDLLYQVNMLMETRKAPQEQAFGAYTRRILWLGFNAIKEAAV